jgi:hypothetical protein
VESCEASEEGRRAGGRQTRTNGWKGGRDFVSSSFFLVVEMTTPVVPSMSVDSVFWYTKHVHYTLVWI